MFRRIFWVNINTCSKRGRLWC